MSDAFSTINLKKWIEDHRHELKPPVGNKLVWKDRQFTVMIVGGPNQRKDFHINPTEEFFHQLEGDMVLRVMDENLKRVDIPIREGEIYLLPKLVPHSPQRPANTVGMVVEMQRPEGQLDHLRYYCDRCDHILFDPTFYCTDLGSQLKPLIEQFKGDEGLRTCDACGERMEF